jgi:hypothetical protein
MSEGSRCIVACTDASGRFDAVREVAVRQAAEHAGSRVIFYDVTNDGTFSDPRPNFWAGEGEAEMYDQPLDPIKIEKLGRHDLAVQVMRAREAGVDAYGWLPNEAGGKGLLAYADRVGADLVLLPATDEDDMAPYVDELRSATTDASKPLTAQVQLVDAESQVTPI